LDRHYSTDEVFQFSYLYDIEADEFQNLISSFLSTEICGEIFTKICLVTDGQTDIQIVGIT